MKFATIYKRGAVLIIHPTSKTTAGVGIGTPPFLVVDADASPGIIGRELVQALQAGRSGIPHPVDWSNVGTPLLEAAKVRSWSAFVRGTLCCVVSDDGKDIGLIPTVNRGARTGFEHLPDDELSVPSTAPPEQVGLAVRKALELAE